MTVTNLKKLMTKSRKSLKQISIETGIGQERLTSYSSGSHIKELDGLILARYFKTNLPYLKGIWELKASDDYIARFKGIFKTEASPFIIKCDDVFEDAENCFYNLWIQSIEFSALQSNSKAKRFFEKLTYLQSEEGILVVLPDDEILESLKNYNDSIRHHFGTDGDYKPIETYKGITI